MARRSLARVAPGAALVALAALLVAWLAAGPQRTGGQPSALRAAPAGVLPARPVPSAAADPLPHDRVPAAAPSQFVISGPAFTVSAGVCGMPPVFPLDPPGDQVHTVCWVDHGFGVAPASSTRGTTYVLGHSWAEAPLVLNPLSEFATAHEQQADYLANGVATYSVPALRNYAITLTTPTGKLGYRVTTAYLVGKLDARKVSSLMATGTPNRVVLITCAVSKGLDLPQNVILYATLAWSKAKR
jgi:hypothetical protein